MDGSAVLEALKGLAGGPTGSPGGVPAGAPPGGPPGAPGGVPAAPGVEGGQRAPQPEELVQGGLLALFLGLSQMGLQETANDIVERLQKRLERLYKSSPRGQQMAAMASRVPPSTPPGVGTMPGLPGVGG